MSKKILLIEDDSHVASFVKKGLAEEQFVVYGAQTGEEGLRAFEANGFDLLIIDIMLPGISGLEVCTQVRTRSNVPILLLTALGTAENVALGLNTGADDYLVKPFKFIELLARIRSLLRRAERSEQESGSVFSFEDIVIHDDKKSVTYAGTLVQLTATEYRLLRMFVANAKRVLSRAAILEEVWDGSVHLGTNVVDVYVNYLRKKLENAGAPKLIQTVTGMGYVLKHD